MKRYGAKERILIIQAIIFAVMVLATFSYTATAQALLQIGTQAPDFALRDMEGKNANLSQYSRKKAVVVVFWSTWSANSPKALRRFEEFHRKYKDRGIQIIGINADNQIISDEDMEKIRKLLKEMDITFPILLDKGLKTLHDYSTIALPSTVVITEGKISYELPGFPLVGAEDMFDNLQALAGETLRKKVEPKYKPRHDAIADTSLARGFVSNKKYEMAYPLFQKAIEKDPKFMLPYVELARLYELEGRNAEAEDTLKKALSIEPDNVAVMSELGYLQTKTGKLKEAIKILDNAVKKESYTPSHYYYAYALGMSGQLKEALNAFDQAISLNPYDPMTYQLRAEVYEKDKMAKEAASDYRKALELILKIKH